MLIDSLATHRRSGPLLHVLLRVLLRILAVLDAIFVQMAGLWWIARLPAHGGLLGGLAAVGLITWATCRGTRALFEFDNYRWIALKMAGWALMLWCIGLTVQLWRHVSTL